MLKKMFLAGGLALVMAGATMTAAPQPAQACHSGCFKKAKALYGHDLKKRHAFAKACRKHYKAYRKAHHKGLLHGRHLFKH
jgi:hypothetical protein